MNPDQVLSRGHSGSALTSHVTLGKSLPAGLSASARNQMSSHGLLRRGPVRAVGAGEQQEANLNIRDRGQECARKNRMWMTNRTILFLTSLVTWMRRRGLGRGGTGHKVELRRGLPAFPCPPRSTDHLGSPPSPSPSPRDPSHLPQNKGTKGRHSVNLKLLLFLPVVYTQGGGGVGERNRRGGIASPPKALSGEAARGGGRPHCPRSLGLGPGFPQPWAPPTPEMLR